MNDPRKTLVALRDNLTEPARGILDAVIELVDEPGPSNNLSWALEAFAAHERERVADDLYGLISALEPGQPEGVSGWYYDGWNEAIGKALRLLKAKT